ncbi:MAG: hypothetical protein RMN25_00325 [Anaerolineae bacterium]|nr:hypothetical protein [Thermoflexales bacterium]MDW8406205.1 hypothetical protein [Anaerolineae bacterium]
MFDDFAHGGDDAVHISFFSQQYGVEQPTCILAYPQVWSHTPAV